MNRATLDSIIEQYEISYPQDDNATLADRIRQKMVAIHPDKTGGEFPSRDKKAEYLRLQQALDYVNSLLKPPKDLIPLSQVTALVEAVAKTISAKSTRTPEEAKRSCRNDIRIDLTRRQFVPRITSAAFAAGFAGLIGLSELTKDNPLYTKATQIPDVQIVFGIGLISSAVLFVFTWIREALEEQRVQWMMSEDGSLALMSRAIRMAGHDRDHYITLTRRILVDILTDRYGRRKNVLTQPARLFCTLPASAVDKVADYLLATYVAKGVLEVVPTTKWASSYRISREDAEELYEMASTSDA